MPFGTESWRTGRCGLNGQGLRWAITHRATLEMLYEQITSFFAWTKRQQLWPCHQRYQKVTQLFFLIKNECWFHNSVCPSKPRSLIDPSKTAATTITAATAIQRSSYDAAKLSCCDRGTLQCYRLCRTAHTNEFFPETVELDECVAQPSEAALATCFEDGIIL